MIKLTLYNPKPGEKFAWANPAYIIEMQRYSNLEEISEENKITNGYTQIWYTSSHNTVKVTETPEEIIELIRTSQ